MWMVFWCLISHWNIHVSFAFNPCLGAGWAVGVLELEAYEGIEEMHILLISKAKYIQGDEWEVHKSLKIWKTQKIITISSYVSIQKHLKSFPEFSLYKTKWQLLCNQHLCKLNSNTHTHTHTHTHTLVKHPIGETTSLVSPLRKWKQLPFNIFVIICTLAYPQWCGTYSTSTPIL